MTEGSEMELGGKFWLMFIGGAIACALAGLLLFFLIGTAWARWGFLVMFLFLAVVSLAVGWIFDTIDENHDGQLSIDELAQAVRDYHAGLLDIPLLGR